MRSRGVVENLCFACVQGQVAEIVVRVVVGRSLFDPLLDPISLVVDVGLVHIECSGSRFGTRDRENIAHAVVGLVVAGVLISRGAEIVPGQSMGVGGVCEAPNASRKRDRLTPSE